MKPIQVITLLAALGLFFNATGRAAQPDLAAVIADVAKYESGASAEGLRQLEAFIREAVANPAKRPEVEAGLIKLLAPTSTPEGRRFACQQLAVIGTEASLPALAELLKNEETVGIACLALGNYTTPKANDVLRNALGSGSAVARAQIITTLGDRADAGAVKLLVPLALDKEALVAESAFSALGRIATPEAVKSLLVLRKTTVAPADLHAAQAMLVAADVIAAKDPKTAAVLYGELLAGNLPMHLRRAAFEGLLRLDKDGGEQRIAATLKGTEAALKPSAIARIGQLKSATAVKKFAKDMPALQPAEQVLMVEMLAARGDAASRSAISEAVSAPDGSVRRAAIAAVGQLGDASSVPMLTKALGGVQDTAERQAIEAALAGLTGGEAVDKALAATLKQRAAIPHPPIIAVLGKRGSHVAVPALMVEAASPDAATASAAFQALNKLSAAEDLNALVGLLVNLKAPSAREDAENAVAQALAKTTDQSRRAEAICGALPQAGDLDTRLSLVRLLPACGGPTAFAALKTARADQEARVRDTATRTLADWPDLAAWDALTELYRQSDNEALRVVALRGLVRLAGEANAKPDAAQVGRYRALLAGATGDNDRKLILGALAGCAHPDALALALPLVNSPALKAEASLAVKKIAESIKGSHPQAAQEALKQLK